MKKNTGIWVVIFMLILIIGVFIFTNLHIKEVKNSNLDDETAKPISSQIHHIALNGSGFYPNILQISLGDTIVWVNGDRKTHTVTSDRGDELSSKTLASGESYTHIFNTAGEFNYHSESVPSLRGIVRVT